MGLVYYSLSKFEKAKECQQMSLDIARKIGDRAGEGNAIGNHGFVYHSLGDYKQALELHNLNLEITREVGNIPGESLACNNLGLAYYSLGDLWKAEEFLEVGVTLQDKIRDGLHRKDDWKIHAYYPTIFVAVDRDTVNFWVLKKGKQFAFVKKKIATDLKRFVEEAYKKIGVKKPVKCDDRSLSESSE